MLRRQNLQTTIFVNVALPVQGLKSPLPSPSPLLVRDTTTSSSSPAIVIPASNSSSSLHPAPTDAQAGITLVPAGTGGDSSSPPSPSQNSSLLLSIGSSKPMSSSTITPQVTSINSSMASTSSQAHTSTHLILPIIIAIIITFSLIFIALRCFLRRRSRRSLTISAAAAAEAAAHQPRVVLTHHGESFCLDPRTTSSDNLGKIRFIKPPFPSDSTDTLPFALDYSAPVLAPKEHNAGFKKPSFQPSHSTDNLTLTPPPPFCSTENLRPSLTNALKPTFANDSTHKLQRIEVPSDSESETGPGDTGYSSFATTNMPYIAQRPELPRSDFEITMMPVSSKLQRCQSETSLGEGMNSNYDRRSWMPRRMESPKMPELPRMTSDASVVTWADNVNLWMPNRMEFPRTELPRMTSNASVVTRADSVILGDDQEI